MRPTVEIDLLAATPAVRVVDLAPFVPTYLLRYAKANTVFYRSPTFGAILQQYDAFDAYIVVLEVKTRKDSLPPLAIPFKTLCYDLHWLYQLKGHGAIEDSSNGTFRRLSLATGYQKQVYTPPTRGTLTLSEKHTLVASIAVKGKWLMHNEATEANPVENLIAFLRNRANGCVTASDVAIEPSMLHLAELFSLPALLGEPMDAAIAQPVSQLVRLARTGKDMNEPDRDAIFVASIQRQVDNHVRAGHVPSVSELAERNGLSIRSLSDRYRANANHKLQTYLSKSRLGEGLRLLMEERFTVGAAAFAIGYAEISVFSAQFKKHYGMCPREYLRIHRG